MPKKSKIFTISILLLAIGLSITLAELFSSIITVGDFAFLSTQTSKCNSYSIYAVSLHKELDESLAEKKVKDVRNKNGAGYIYKKENVFYVLASAYENKSNAEKVVSHLANDNTSSEIVEIQVDKIEIDMNLSTNEKNTMSNAINAFKTTYQSLYDISISLDTQVRNQTECKLLVNELKSNVQKIQSDFDTFFNTKLNQKLLEIKLQLKNLYDVLQTFIEDNPDPFGSSLKYSYLEIIQLNVDLAKEINKM